LLELQNLSFTVDADEGKKEIIHDLNLKVEDRRLVVITGPNGSGKSTLAKLIAGIEKPISGRILLDGEDITEKSITERARLGIGFAFQQPVRFKGFSVRDLLNLANGSPLTDDMLDEVLLKVGLDPKAYKDRDVDTKLSGGEIKRIEIAGVLLRKSKLTVFDEPEAGIDLWSFNSLIQVFEELREARDVSMVIISHQERILNIADEIMLIQDGRLGMRGSRDIMYPLICGDGCNTCPALEEGDCYGKEE
jgi:Fe-S cluster assembly ATP-binding protein